MKSLFLFLILYACSLPDTVTSFCWTAKYDVHVINQLPPGSKLTLHCASKDNDLGHHTLANNQEFQWHFCDHWLGHTLFFCTFGWGSKKQSFDVFTSKFGNDLCFGGVCFWLARSDGFYFHGFKRSTSKLYEWK